MMLKESNFSSQREFQLAANAASLTALGKGILAADESPGTIEKRFKEFNILNEVETRRSYRELLLTSGAELGTYIGGVILHEETVDQTAANGKPFVILLQELGILSGVKLDKGPIVASWTSAFGETCVEGLENLNQRCKQFYEKGIRFAKWRAVFKITQNTPTDLAIKTNVVQLAQYASICQANGLVPIVEPEILMDGKHSLEICMFWQARILSQLISALNEHSVLLEGTLLKTNFVLPGIEFEGRVSDEEIANATISALSRTIPPAMAGIVFLSGGLSERRATSLLNAVNKTKTTKAWPLSFSFGRALQHSALEKWQGKEEGILQAQACLIHRAKMNSLASNGTLMVGEDEESSFVASSQRGIHEANYFY